MVHHYDVPSPAYSTHTFGDAQRAATVKEVRKPTAAEYATRRVAEQAEMLLNEIERIEGQYNRLRAHFGIPPEPQSAGRTEKTQSSDGMEAGLGHLNSLILRLSATVSQMNELV